MPLLDLREIRLLYLRELRTALRDRSIVVPSLLVPLLLYPILLWGLVSAMTFVRGQEERFVSRVVVLDSAVEQEEFLDALKATERLELLPPPQNSDAAVAAGEVDAVVELLPAAGDAARLEENFRAVIRYDSARDRSRRAEERVVGALRDLRQERLEAAGRELGLPPEAWSQFEVETLNLATGREIGAFLLGLLVPMLTIIMLAIGCLNPAIDTLAGERERSTWETLLVTGASRSSLVLAKYFYVATLGCVAALLNLFAITLSMRTILASALGDNLGDLSFRIPLSAVPVVLLLTVLLALFVSAGMMLLASFARTFKEGQSLVMPFYLLCLVPTLLVQSPDLRLTPGWALVPISNVTLVFREAISGTFQWPLIGLVLVVELLCIGICLALARWALGFEEVVVGEVPGGLGKFLQQKFRPGTTRAGTSEADS